MSSKKWKIKDAKKGNNIQKTYACEGLLVINKDLRLSIRLNPEDDLPHPRHLCFAYPFGKTSPKRHCSKAPFF